MPAFAQTETTKVCFEDNCFKVELATTDQAKQKGLMYRKDLDDDKGMLFVFEKMAWYSFWMKNTYIALDLIWLDENKRIVHIVNNAKPCLVDLCVSYHPQKS